MNMRVQGNSRAVSTEASPGDSPPLWDGSPCCLSHGLRWRSPPFMPHQVRTGILDGGGLEPHRTLHLGATLPGRQGGLSYILSMSFPTNIFIPRPRASRRGLSAAVPQPRTHLREQGQQFSGDASTAVSMPSAPAADPQTAGSAARESSGDSPLTFSMAQGIGAGDAAAAPLSKRELPTLGSTWVRLRWPG